jgi:adenosine deaminase
MLAAIAERRIDPQQPVDAHLILCLVRELGEMAAAQTLMQALPYVMALTGLGLASAEVGNPPGDFKDVYRAAGLLGLHKVAHAGEGLPAPEANMLMAGK